VLKFKFPAATFTRLTMTETTPFLPGLSPVCGKELLARFDGGQMSSDGGVLLLREIEAGLGIAWTLASCLPDGRDPKRVRHGYDEMIRARVFAIACGHEDCDDLDLLRFDPAFKLACGRLPGSGDDLMSQPSLSRLENIASWRDLARMGFAMIDLFCGSFARVPERITLDIDETADAAHGQQELAFFNAYYDATCFQPIHVFEAGSGKPVLALLRPGKRPSGREAASIVAHVTRRIRANWPRVKILWRGDSHYATPEVLETLEARDCSYIFGLAGNTKLKGLAAPWCEDAALRRLASAKDKLRRFHQSAYRAGSWKKERRVIARVEASAKGADVRFVVTNLPGRAKWLYEKAYCARGQAENLIKDMKTYTKSDRTSCHRWQANQFRLTLHMGAYWLLNSLRRSAPKRSPWRGATFQTIRLTFLKIAARITELKSRVTIALPSAYPNQKMLILLAGKAAAQGP
jgi:hypothetical protein